MVLIRTATREDAVSISQVHVASWRTTYRGIVPARFLDELNTEERAAQWLKIIDSGSYLIVAERAGQIVGFINGGSIREALENHDAELYAIYLLVEAQGKGIGTALLIELAKRLRGAGFQSMIVWMLEANDSFRFYEKTAAVRIAAKEIEIGGALLPIVAYSSPNLGVIATLDIANPTD
jgi:L-amino acid N-acyltransferase YncA